MRPHHQDNVNKNPQGDTKRDVHGQRMLLQRTCMKIR